MSEDDFQLAAALAEASYSLDAWISIGQAGRSAAIYRELRAIDMHTAERRHKAVETARSLVREGEGRVARQEVLLAGVETAQGSEFYSRQKVAERNPQLTCPRQVSPAGVGGRGALAARMMAPDAGESLRLDRFVRSSRLSG